MSSVRWSRPDSQELVREFEEISTSASVRPNTPSLFAKYTEALDEQLIASLQCYRRVTSALARTTLQRRAEAESLALALHTPIMPFGVEATGSVYLDLGLVKINPQNGRGYDASVVYIGRVLQGANRIAYKPIADFDYTELIAAHTFYLHMVGQGHCIDVGRSRNSRGTI